MVQEKKTELVLATSIARGMEFSEIFQANKMQCTIENSHDKIYVTAKILFLKCIFLIFYL